MKSFLKSAKIVGKNVDVSVYMRQEPDVRRGDANFVLSRSDLMEFYLCPRRWKDGHKDGDSSATEWGNLMDCLFLTADKFESQYVLEPLTFLKSVMECPVCQSVSDSAKCSKCKTERVKKQIEKSWSNLANECKEWNAKQDKEIIKLTDYQDAKSAVEKLKRNEIISQIVNNSDKQVMVIAEVELFGITLYVKVLIDIAGDDLLGDFKTTKCANPGLWHKEIYKRNYHVQAALCTDLYSLASGEPIVDFIHIVQENFAPFEVMEPVACLSADFIDAGRYKYQQALKFYAQCVIENNWPSYAPVRDCIGGFQIIQPDEYMKEPGREFISKQINETESEEVIP